MRLYFWGCFALCFALLGAARSLPRARVLWARLSLWSLQKPQTPGRGDGFGTCVRAGMGQWVPLDRKSVV